MLARGVYLPPSAFESWFLSAAHDDAALDRVADALPPRRAARGRDHPRSDRDERDDGRPPAAPRRGAQPRRRALRPAARLPPLRARPADGRARRRAPARRRDITHVVASPLERAQETAAPIAEALGLDGRHRRPADRGRQRLRGQDVRGRRRVAAPARALGAPAQPVPAVLGRAVHARSPADARRGGRRARRRPRARGAVRQPPAADLDRCGRSRAAGGSGTTRASGSARWPR